MVFIAKTGGSTGAPKNVALSDRSFNHMVHQYLSSELDYQAGDRWLRLWPIFSATAAVSSNHLPLCAGMELILEPTGNIMALGETLLRERPNHIPMAPAILDILLNSPALNGQDLSFLKSVGCGGSGMTEEFEKKVYEFFEMHNIQIYLGCGYGMTENGSVATIRMNRETAKIGSGGVPMIDMDVAVFRPDTYIEEPYNTMGEICIRSNTFMMGYLGNEALTHQVLRDHGNGEVWLHSGDLGYMDEDGLVYIKDRLTRIFTAYPCEKIYPNEIEEQVETITGVDMAAVFAISDSGNEGFYFAACAVTVQPGYDRQTVIDAVRKYCETHFPAYARPRMYEVCDDFPMTPIGKIDYRALENEAALKQ